MTTTSPPATASYIDRLDEVVRRGDRARLAALRQLVAPPARWGPDVYATAMALLPPVVVDYEEDLWLFVAGLHALWHRGRSTPAPHSGSTLGSSVRTLGRRKGLELAPAVERRFSVLLTSSDERLHHHLRQAVTQLAGEGIGVDFVRLLSDLRHWDHPDRYVQRRWAREFWQPRASAEQQEPDQEEGT